MLQWISDRYCVGEVPRPYLSVITPYSLELEVDRGSESHVESFVFFLPKDCRAPLLWEVIALFMTFLANITMHRYNLF